MPFTIKKWTALSRAVRLRTFSINSSNLTRKELKLKKTYSNSSREMWKV